MSKNNKKTAAKHLTINEELVKELELYSVDQLLDEEWEIGNSYNF